MEREEGCWAFLWAGLVLALLGEGDGVEFGFGGEVEVSVGGGHGGM